MRRFALLALLILAAVAQADHFRFVVAGDGRSDPSKNRPEDKDGVNTLITGEIAQATIAEHAKFLLWTGDLVLGTKKLDEFKTMLLRWQQVMQPVYDAKIPVLACRGNHEDRGPGSDDVWREVFSGKYAMPNNGPSTEKDMTFYRTFGPVLVVGLDQYTVEKKNIAVNQPWLDDVLAKNKAPFIFTFAHEPAFMDGAHKDLMDNDPVKRDAFWESLIRAGSRVFFCGHDHLYDHMTVVPTNENGIHPVMHQLVAGTAGAPFYPEGAYSGDNTSWSLTRIKNITKTYGYITVDIDGNKATITFKGRVAPGVYKPMDTFSYTLNDVPVVRTGQ